MGFALFWQGMERGQFSRVGSSRVESGRVGSSRVKHSRPSGAGRRVRVGFVLA